MSTSKIQKGKLESNQAEIEISPYFDYLAKMLQSLQSKNWSDMEFYLNNMKKQVKSVAKKEPVILSIHNIVNRFALGFQELDKAKTEEENENALKHLSDIRKKLINLSIESPQLYEDNGVAEMILGLEQTILSQQLKSAVLKGDTSKEIRLRQQLLQSQETTSSLLGSDDSGSHLEQASKIFIESYPKSSIGRQALFDMNLDRAERFFEECRRSSKEALVHIEKANNDDLTTKAMKSYFTGLVLWINGDYIYIKVLRSAILGEITKKDINDLEKIEDDYLHAADMLRNASSIIPGQINLITELEKQSDIVHNFRSLCERSLTPKGIASTATPKIVIYFLGTFLVLLFGLPASGLMNIIKSQELFLIAVVSLFVSVIGAFGVEAVRFVPIFDSFAKMFTLNIGKIDKEK